MKKAIKRVLKNSPLFPVLRPIAHWLRPKPAAEPVKHQTVTDYARRVQAKSLVETGTYRGDMLAAVKDRFSSLYSIELGKPLADAAKERFRNEPKIRIIEGDSGTMLRRILPEVESPVVFWLDGHYSEGCTAKGAKETPILEELESIFRHPEMKWVILIDDARLFTGEHDYPSLGALKKYVRAANPAYRVEVAQDIIRITPPPVP